MFGNNQVFRRSLIFCRSNRLDIMLIAEREERLFQNNASLFRFLHIMLRTTKQLQHFHIMTLSL